MLSSHTWHWHARCFFERCWQSVPAQLWVLVALHTSQLLWFQAEGPLMGITYKSDLKLTSGISKQDSLIQRLYFPLFCIVWFKIHANFKDTDFCICVYLQHSSVLIHMQFCFCASCIQMLVLCYCGVPCVLHLLHLCCKYSNNNKKQIFNNTETNKNWIQNSIKDL